MICTLTIITTDALVTDIRTDIEVAKHSLERRLYAEAKHHSLFQ